MSFGRLGALGRGFGRMGVARTARSFIGVRADSTLVTADAAGLLADRTSVLVDTNHFTSDQSALSADYAR